MIASLFIAFLLALQVGQTAPAGLADDLAAFGAGLRSCGITGLPEFNEDSPLTREYWITLSGPDVSETSARCLAASPTLDNLSIDFTDPVAAAAFAVARSERPDIKAAREESLRRQGEWLAERGLLEHRPRLVMNEPLSAFAVAAERHCGLAPGTILKANDETRSLTLVGQSHPSFEQFSCVFSVVSLAMEGAPDVALAIEGEDAVE